MNGGAGGLAVGMVDKSVTVRSDLDAAAVRTALQTGSHSFCRLWVERRKPPVPLALTSASLGVDGTTRVRLRELLPVAGPAVVYLAGELWRYRITRLGSVLDGAVPRDPDELVLSRALPNPIGRPLHRSHLAPVHRVTHRGRRASGQDRPAR